MLCAMMACLCCSRRCSRLPVLAGSGGRAISAAAAAAAAASARLCVGLRCSICSRLLPRCQCDFQLLKVLRQQLPGSER